MTKTYLFKAMWRSTALVLKVSATSPEKAMKRAAYQVSKMDGGEFCEDIIFLGEATIQQSRPYLTETKP